MAQLPTERSGHAMRSHTAVLRTLAQCHANVMQYIDVLLASLQTILRTPSYSRLEVYVDVTVKDILGP